MKDYAKFVAREWCYPEEHHWLATVLAYHCVNDGKSARVPRVEIRDIGTNELIDVFIGHEAVRFLTLLNEECQKLLE